MSIPINHPMTCPRCSTQMRCTYNPASVLSRYAVGNLQHICDGCHTRLEQDSLYGLVIQSGKYLFTYHNSQLSVYRWQDNPVAWSGYSALFTKPYTLSTLPELVDEALHGVGL